MRYTVLFYLGGGKRKPPILQAIEPEPTSFPGSLFFPSPRMLERTTVSPASGEGKKRDPDKEAALQPLRLKNVDCFQFNNFQLVQLLVFFLLDGVPVVSCCTLFLFYGG